MKALVFLALTTAALPPPSPAIAAPISATATTVTKAVRTDDLDLSTASGRGRLEHRVAAAVAKVCAEATVGSPAPPPNDPTCVREHLAQARTAIDRLVAQATQLRGTIDSGH